MDGTPPAYFLRKGSGDDQNKWIVFMIGGAWCFFERFDVGGEITDWMGCYERSKISWDRANTTMGTTNNLPESIKLGGLLSDDPTINAHFYNWNHVYVVYCDGFSFAGNR